MKDKAPHSLDELDLLLTKAEAHLAKSEFAQAEKLAVKVLSSPLLSPAKNSSEEFNSSDAKRCDAQANCILGVCCTATQRATEAFVYFETAFASAEAAASPSLQARALNGAAILQRGDQHAALVTAERALTFAEQAADKPQQARSLNILGSLNTDLANYPRALEYYVRALARAEDIGDTKSVAAYLGNIGNVHRILGDYSRALDYFARALAIAERIPDKVLIERNLHLIGEVYSGTANHERALEFFARALVLAEQLGNRANIEGLYISIGIVHSALADYARALDYYDRALTIAEEIGDKFGFAASLDNIGTVYWNLADYPRALDYFSRALAIAEEIGAKTLIANHLGNTGIVHKDSGDYASALEYLQRALQISEETGDRSQTGHWMHGIACARRKLGHLEAAHQGFLDTLHHRRDVLHTNEGVAETLLELGVLLREQGHDEAALARMNEALNLSEQLGEKKYTAQAHKEIADVHAALGETAKAFDHFKRYHALDKEVFSEESQKRIEIFHIRAAVADKEREAELHRLRADRSEHDLATSTMQLLSQSELLSKVRDDLYDIVRRIPSSLDASTPFWEPAIRELKEKLKELPSKSVDWTKFEAQFTSVHPGFKGKLLKKFPELTKQELKMCLLGRLGITTRDMALLLCLSERTIDSHRLSLRKKIGMKPEQNLSKFLAELD